MEKLQKAISFAATAHAGQKRTNGEPYITHPVHVMAILQSCGENDEDVLCAAMLHDVIEDTTATEQQIEQSFGSDVLEMVKQLTNKHPSKTDFWVRHKAMIYHAKMMNEGAKKIKIADRFHNISSLGDWELWRQKRYANSALELLNAIVPIPESMNSICIKLTEMCQSILSKEEIK